MSATAALVGILGALLIGAISPGPSVLLVSRIAVTASRRDGLAAAIGMGLGGALFGALFGALALAGLGALLPAVPPAWLLIALPPLIFAVEASWYAAVALTLSASRPRAVYHGSRRWLDRAAAAVMGALGVRLLVDGIGSRQA